MIRPIYQWKINDFSTQQIGRDEHGELWFQTWQDDSCPACDGDRVVTEEVAQAGDQVLTEDIACPACTSGWQMYHPHHGGIEAEELLRLVEQQSEAVRALRRVADRLVDVCEQLPGLHGAASQPFRSNLVNHLGTTLGVDIGEIRSEISYLRRLADDPPPVMPIVFHRVADRLTAALRGEQERPLLATLRQAAERLSAEDRASLLAHLRSGEQAGAEDPQSHFYAEGYSAGLAVTGADADRAAARLRRVEEVRQEMAAWSGARPARVDELVVCLRRWAARLADPAPESPVAGGGEGREASRKCLRCSGFLEPVVPGGVECWECHRCQLLFTAQQLAAYRPGEWAEQEARHREDGARLREQSAEDSAWEETAPEPAATEAEGGLTFGPEWFAAEDELPEPEERGE